MHFHCLLLAKIVSIYAFSVCKILSPENWVVKFSDKFQVCNKLQCASETNHWNSASAQLASKIVQSMFCTYRSKILARPLEIIPDDQ